MKHLCWLALIPLLLAPATSRAQTTVDFRTMGTFQVAELHAGGLTAIGSADIYVLNLNGLGIVGGYTETYVDGNEFVTFRFDAGAASQVSYLVTAAGNLDGDGDVGDSFLEAFDVFGHSLGSVPVNEGGPHDVSAAFGNVPLSGFRVTANIDGLRIGSVSYTPMPPPNTVDFRTMGTFQMTELHAGGLTAIGSADIYVLNLNGLGIVGGYTETYVDGNEFVTFRFDAGAASQVSYLVSAAGNLDGDGDVGDSFLEAFDVSGHSLGSVPVNEGGPHDVSAAFGNVPLSGFRVTANIDGLRIGSVSHTPMPTPVLRTTWGGLKSIYRGDSRSR